MSGTLSAPMAIEVATGLSAMAPLRQHVDRLVDRGSFDEWGLAPDLASGGALVGRAVIGGRDVALFAYGAETGSVDELAARKLCRLVQHAMEVGLPLVGLYGFGCERGGHAAEAGWMGELATAFVHASGVIPQLGVVLGRCHGEAALATVLADFLIGGGERAELGLAQGPRVVQGPEGPEPGLFHRQTRNEAEALCAVRRLLAFLPSAAGQPAPRGPGGDDPFRETPEIAALVPEEPFRAYDTRRLLAAVVDHGDFFELEPDRGASLVVGFARLDRRTVGVVASQPARLAGVLDIAASLKGARFVRFCDAFGIPVVTFVDVPGFLPGIQQEMGGIIKHGAKLIYAYAQATVPKVTLIVRKAYGGAYAVMGSKHLATDYNLAYPGAEVAVMGAEAAVGILHRRELDRAGGDAEAVRERRAEDYRRAFANPYVVASHGYVDAVIEPRVTRRELAAALATLTAKRRSLVARKHGNLPL